MDLYLSVSSTNMHEKSKIVARRSHAGTQLLLLGVAFDRKRDEAIEQLRIGDAACGPHLRVHADRGEAGDGVQLVEVQRSGAVVGKKKVDARHARAVERFECRHREQSYFLRES